MDEDLLATCAGLGYTEEDKYYRGEECWECAKDLISFLKLDDESACTHRLQIATAHILQKDLLSILVNFHEDERLMDVIIRLILNLTQPAQTCMNKHPTVKKADLMDMGVYMALNAHLRRYKEAFTIEAVFQVLGSILGKFCQKEYDKRTDDDIHLVERILGIVRNVLHVPADPAEEKRTSDDVSLHDQIIWSLHTNGFFELFVYIASSSEEQDWLLYIAEIMFLMMREQNSSALVSALRGARAIEEKEQDNRELSLLLERERAMKAKKSATYGSRHSRFLGTYTCSDVKGIGDRMLIYHKPLHEANNISFDQEKRGRKKSRHRRPAETEDLKRTSTLSIRKVLANFCVDFLKSCYNQTMHTIRSRLAAGRCQTNDETYYLWCLRFFMEFSRRHSFDTDLVSETLTMDAFNFIMKQVFSSSESIQLEKNEAARPWSKRLQYAIQAYRELLEYVQVLALSSDEEVRDNAKIMQRNIFYIPEYRDIFLALLKNYDEVKSDKSFLSDVVETVHLYVKLIEKYCKDRGGRIMVQARKKASKGRGKKSGGGAGRAGAAANKRGAWSLTDEQMQELWDEHAEFSTSALESLSSGNDEDNDALPFDAASELPEDVQRSSTAELIRSHLLSSAYRRACQLFRAARDIWSDGTFGRADSTVEDEVVCMRQIFFNMITPDLAPDDDAAETEAAGTQEGGGDGTEGREFIGAGADDDDEDDEGGGGGGSVSYDFEFNLQNYIAKFASFRVVRNYGLVLERYQTNSVPLNHCVVKMMYRIAHDCQLMPLFFQLSLFGVFDRILNDPAATNKHMSELYKLSAYIVRAFTERVQENPVLYAEALFWKDASACYEIQNGYGSAKTSKDRILAQKVWTDEQKEQLAQLYERFQGSSDLVSDIMVELEHEPPRSRRQVSQQLMKQGLVTSRKELQQKRAPRQEGDGARKAKSAKWADNDAVPSDSSSDDDDDDVDTVLARLQNQAEADMPDENDADSELPVRAQSSQEGAGDASVVIGLDDDSDDDNSRVEAARPARAPRPRVRRPQQQRERGKRKEDVVDSDVISDADDSDSDDNDASTSLKIDVSAARDTSSDDGSDGEQRNTGESQTPSFATARRNRIADDSDDDAAAADSSSPPPKAVKKPLASPRRAAASTRHARFDSDSDDDDDDNVDTATHRAGSGVVHASAAAADVGGDSHTPEFAAATRHARMIADDSSEDETTAGERNEAADDVGGDSHTPGFAALADSGVDESASTGQGTQSTEDGMESQTPHFATRHGRIADDSDDDADDDVMPTLRASVGGTKRARLADSSDDDTEDVDTQATPSFAKRIYDGDE